MWSYDRKAGQYYLHRFYEHQPDLNVAHPAVREEIARIVGFWLQVGVSGFRVDAVPFLIELDGIAGARRSTPTGTSRTCGRSCSGVVARPSCSAR